MITLKQFNDSTSLKRRHMAERLKEKVWKSGKREGKVRRAKRELPFTLQEFRAWVMERMGLGAKRCFYCPRPIDCLSFEPDHYMPLELGGGVGLDNLVDCCEDCNRLKGAMPPDDFILLMAFMDTNISAAGRNDIKKRLRAGAMGIRQRHFPGEKKPPQRVEPVAATKELDFF